ncbi:hypothetical protein F4808DRAFT_442409 [Astrocystis sublimbata]|nr:hypothetical protein F4808DRAFT_442409 [Astrocystis sublimbata]
MASKRKSYLLAPSWELEPSEVTLGSVIASVNSPQKALMTGNLSTMINTNIHIQEAKDCSGKVKDGNEWGIGLFATFVRMISAGGTASYSSKSSLEIEYSCVPMQTRRLTLLPEFVAEIAADLNVKSHFKIGGIGAKAFIVTGVKIAEGFTITTTEGAEVDTNIHIGAELPAAQIMIGPKAKVNPIKYQTHTATLDGPVVFAFQVEKLRVNRKGQASNKEYIRGAMLEHKHEDIEYVIEVADKDLDDDDLLNIGVESCDGLDENGEGCRIMIPATKMNRSLDGVKYCQTLPVTTTGNE